MGRVILCIGNKAKTPYEIKKLGIRVFSIEELCFCIGEYTFLLDEGMVNRELVDWIREECGLTELADSLYGFIKTKGSVSAFAATILAYTGYYPEAEQKRIEHFLKSNAGLSELEKRKKSADYLLDKQKYVAALMQYQEMLEHMPENTVEIREEIYHNMGCAYAKLFMFENAGEFFMKSYETGNRQESLLQFLASKRMLLKEEEYISFIAEHSEEYYETSLLLEKKMEQIDKQWKKCRLADELECLSEEKQQNIMQYYKDMEKKAEALKEQYRDMVVEK